jgi:hypothetical protein
MVPILQPWMHLVWNIFLENLNQMVVMDFWKVKIGPCFQKSFQNRFFFPQMNIGVESQDVLHVKKSNMNLQQKFTSTLTNK